LQAAFAVAAFAVAAAAAALRGAGGVQVLADGVVGGTGLEGGTEAPACWAAVCFVEHKQQWGLAQGATC